MLKYITTQTALKLQSVGFSKYVSMSSGIEGDRFYLNKIGLDFDLDDSQIIFYKNQNQRINAEIEEIKQWIVEHPKCDIINAEKQINAHKQQIYRNNKKVAKFNKVFETAIAFHNIESEIPTVDIYA